MNEETRRFMEERTEYIIKAEREKVIEEIEFEINRFFRNNYSTDVRDFMCKFVEIKEKLCRTASEHIEQSSTKQVK